MPPIEGARFLALHRRLEEEGITPELVADIRAWAQAHIARRPDA